MVASGYSLGLHTMTHPDLSVTPSDQIVREFTEIRDLLELPSILGSAHPLLATARAPFGRPFQYATPDVARVAPLVAQFGINIGWNLDSHDWECTTPQCVVDWVTKGLDSGEHGPILMHSVYPVTVEALPAVIALMQGRGYRFVSVDTLLQLKYGATAAQLMKVNQAH
jgi:peptidoglycan/xylan/chitin deacetylase (PgdA/CDA1 family)